MIRSKWVHLDWKERARTYIFPDGNELEFTNVTDIYIGESGVHYLQCEDGKYIVNTGWLCISIDTNGWTHPKVTP
jgi:hypothetical protein